MIILHSSHRKLPTNSRNLGCKCNEGADAVQIADLHADPIDVVR